MPKRLSKVITTIIKLSLIFLLVQVKTSFAENEASINSKITDLELIGITSRNASIAADNLSISLKNTINFINSTQENASRKDNTMAETAIDTAIAIKAAARSARKAALLTRNTTSLIMESSPTAFDRTESKLNLLTQDKTTQEKIQILITAASEKAYLSAKLAADSAETANTTTELEVAIKAANQVAASTEEVINIFEELKEESRGLMIMADVPPPNCDDEETDFQKWLCELTKSDIEG